MQASVAEDICESCASLIKVSETALGCTAHDKFIIPGYLPYHGNCKCKDWTKKRGEQKCRKLTGLHTVSETQREYPGFWNTSRRQEA